MSRLFLCGGMTSNFGAITTPFVAAAGRGAGRIALLFPGRPGWEPYVARYRDPWLAAGAGQVDVIVPDPETLALNEEAIATLRTATGIFMGGGETRRYHAAYAVGQVRSLIRERVQAGVPYGGMSAGSLLATERCAIWGDRITVGCSVRPLGGAEKGCGEELQLGHGLGLAEGFVIEAHFSDRGGFPRLVAMLEGTGEPLGIGLDDPVCLEVADGGEAVVHGDGRAWLVRPAGLGQVNVTALEPGTRFALR